MSSNRRPNYWKECDVNHLAGHFHKFNKATNTKAKSKQVNPKKILQFERLGCLYLHRNDIDSLFPEGRQIDSFSIRLGLDSKVSRKEKYTFMPEISVYHKHKRGKKPVVRQFHYDPQPNPNGSVEIPGPLKEWLCKNWMELDSGLIDDAFTASFDDGPHEGTPKNYPVMRTNQRLHSYHFTATNANSAFYKFINTHMGKVDQFMFHLGVDMNKFDHKDMFGFSPIYEVHILKPTCDQIRDHRVSGLRCVPKTIKRKNSTPVFTGDEAVYFEYGTPCPSTCN